MQPSRKNFLENIGINIMLSETGGGVHSESYGLFPLELPNLHVARSSELRVHAWLVHRSAWLVEYLAYV